MADLEARGEFFLYEPDTFKITVPVARVKCQECGVAVTRVTRYTPDFLVHRSNGDGIIYVEAKGKLTPHERRRLEAFHAQYGHLAFAVIFQRNNWLTPAKKARYSDWADEHGIPWAVGESVPEEWL